MPSKVITDVFCEVCNTKTSWELVTAYSADDFYELVTKGFTPPDQTLRPMILMGMSKDEALAQWKDSLVAETTTDWLLCPECEAQAVSLLPKKSDTDSSAGKFKQNLKTERPSAVADKQSNQNRNREHEVAEDRRESRWVAAMEALPSQINRKRIDGAITTITTLGLVSFALFGSVDTETRLMLFSLSIVALMAVVFFFMRSSQIERHGISRITQEIILACEEEKISRQDLVETLGKRVSASKIRHEVLAAIDEQTTTLMEIRENAKEFFAVSARQEITPAVVQPIINQSDGTLSSVTVKGEVYAETFRSMTLSYIEQHAYVEALTTLGMASSIYGQIAPPALRGTVEAQFAGTDFKSQVTRATYDILSQFEFDSEFKAIHETRERRKRQQVLEVLVDVQRQRRMNISARLHKAQLEGIAATAVRDKRLVTTCIGYLGSRKEYNRLQAVEALAQIPEQETIPHLLSATAEFPFLPHVIDSLIQFGKPIGPRLQKTLQATQSTNTRFNLAITLGFMKPEGTREIFQDMLSRIEQPVERIGCAFGMVQLGEISWLDEILQRIDHEDSNTRLAATIAIEHLPHQVGDHVILRGLNDDNELVRLRMTRKLAAQSTKSPALIKALICRFNDSDSSVRSQAIQAAGAADASVAFDLLVHASHHGPFETRAHAIRALGWLNDPRVQPILMEHLTTNTTSIKKATISALGDTKAISAVGEIFHYLSHEELGEIAMQALVNLGMKDTEVVLKELETHGRDYAIEDRIAFIQAALGSEQACAFLAQRLERTQSMELDKLIELLNYALVLHDTRFELPLRKCLDLDPSGNFPGERYVPHLAFKALVHTLLWK
jgi:HEAT repeat protein